MHLHLSRLYLSRSSPPYSPFSVIHAPLRRKARKVGPSSMAACSTCLSSMARDCTQPIPSSGVDIDFTNISFGRRWLRCFLGRRRHPYIWRQGSLAIPRWKVLELMHSKRSSSGMSQIFATSPLKQTLSFFTKHSNDLLHLLPLSNAFHCSCDANYRPRTPSQAPSP
jgi:hypothetical protein